MAVKKTISVFEKVIKQTKTAASSVLKEVKTDGTLSGTEKLVIGLKKRGVNYFEILNRETNTKTTYKKTISGKNYEVNVLKIN